MITASEVFWVLGAFAFAFGGLIGSFLNVVIYRVPADLSVVTPRSRCPSCETPIAWYDNIPVLSWAILLRAKCRHCGAPIPWRYPLVELVTATFALVAWWQMAGGLLRMSTMPDPAIIGPVMGLFLMRFAFFAFLIAISFIDLDTMLIPHKISIPGIVLGLASPWIAQALIGARGALRLWPPVTPAVSLAGAIAGFLIIVGLFYFYFAVRGIPGLGGGDATLMAFIGAWLGWPALIFVLFAASLQGVVLTGIAMLVGADFTKNAADIFAEDATEEEIADRPEDWVDPADGRLAIPFGPFLALAAVEYAIFGPVMPDELSLIYMYL